MGCMMATSSSGTERTAASSSPRFRLVESFSLSESKKALPRLRYFALSSPLLLVVRSLSPLARLRSLLSRPLPACRPPPASRCTCTASWSCRSLRCVSRAGCSVRRCRCCRCYGAAHAVAHLSLSLSRSLALARSAQAPTSPRGRRSSACYYMATSSSTVRRACYPGARSSGPLLLPPCTRARARAERAWLSPRSFVRVCAARC